GLKVIDTRRWSVRTIDPRATDAALVSGRLLAWSLLWDSRTDTFGGSGLTAYDHGGRRLFHRYGNDAISSVQPVGGRIVVGGVAGGRLFRHGALLDARSGRELRRVGFDVGLLVGDEPFWY